MGSDGRGRFVGGSRLKNATHDVVFASAPISSARRSMHESPPDAESLSFDGSRVSLAAPRIGSALLFHGARLPMTVIRRISRVASPQWR